MYNTYCERVVVNVVPSISMLIVLMWCHHHQSLLPSYNVIHSIVIHKDSTINTFLIYSSSCVHAILINRWRPLNPDHKYLIVFRIGLHIYFKYKYTNVYPMYKCIIWKKYKILYTLRCITLIVVLWWCYCVNRIDKYVHKYIILYYRLCS